MPLADIIGTLPEDLRDLLRLLTSEAGFENIMVKSSCNKDELGTVYHFHVWGRYIMRASLLYTRSAGPSQLITYISPIYLLTGPRLARWRDKVVHSE